MNDEKRESDNPAWIKRIPFGWAMNIVLTVVVSTIGVSRGLDDKYVTRAEARYESERVERLAKFVLDQNTAQAQMRADIAATKANTELLIKIFRQQND